MFLRASVPTVNFLDTEILIMSFRHSSRNYNACRSMDFNLIICYESLKKAIERLLSSNF